MSLEVKAETPEMASSGIATADDGRQIHALREQMRYYVSYAEERLQSEHSPDFADATYLEHEPREWGRHLEPMEGDLLDFAWQAIEQEIKKRPGRGCWRQGAEFIVDLWSAEEEHVGMFEVSLQVHYSGITREVRKD